MNRRGFLGAMLAAAVAPAVVSSSVLMPVKTIWTPPKTIRFRRFLPYTYPEWSIDHSADAMRYGIVGSDIVRELQQQANERARLMLDMHADRGLILSAVTANMLRNLADNITFEEMSRPKRIGW